MPKAKTLEEKLRAAAILKFSFTFRKTENEPVFKSVYPGVLRDLGIEDAQVDAYIEAHREEIEKAAGTTSTDDDDDE